MKDYILEIREKCKHLSSEKLILFCNLNCEKMLPGYKIFTQIAKWGDYDFISQLVSSIYIGLGGENSTLQYYKRANEQLENKCPNLDDFEIAAASYAFDVCVAMNQTLQYILTKNIQHVFWNLERSLDTVDMFIQQKEKISTTTFDNLPDLEKMIDEHEYTLKEIERQNIVLDRIKAIQFLTPAEIQSLRALNESFGDQIEYELFFS